MIVSTHSVIGGLYVWDEAYDVPFGRGGEAYITQPWNLLEIQYFSTRSSLLSVGAWAFWIYRFVHIERANFRKIATLLKL